MNSRRTLAVLVIVGVLVAGAGLTAGATTYGLFSAADTGTGSIQAAASFDVPGDGPCVDADGNGQCGPGDIPVDADDLTTFDNDSADLLIPESVGDIDNGNSEISITANNITSEVDIETKTRDISLDAGSGGIHFGGSNVTIDGGSGSVNINSEGDVNLSGSRISTKTAGVQISSNGHLNIDYATIDGRESNQPIDLSGKTISARYAAITNKNGEMILSATNNNGGELDATGATIESRAKNGKLSGASITVESTGTMVLNQTELRVKQTASVEAYIGSTDAVLYTDGIVVVDDDDALYYEPAGVTRRP